MNSHKMSQDRNAKQEQQEAEEGKVLIHGDILEFIFTHVPLIDLVSISRVSKSWKRAVSTSLHSFNTVKPWLIFHTQATRFPYATTAHAYDPRSRLWLQIQHPLITSISPLRSSHSTLLYMLSPSQFSFSSDSMHLMWRSIDAPLVWRSDPVVAVVGHRIIVAGGGCDFEDDPLAVEMYDLKTRKWEKCESMPAIFRNSASSMWLSVAVNGEKMYVADRSTGVAFTFNPETKSWHGPYNLNPDKNVASYCIGFANDRLILIGLMGDDEEPIRSVKLWEIKGESLNQREDMGEMGGDLIEKLRGEGQALGTSSLVVNMMGDFAFIINGSAPEEVILCELSYGGCRWSSVRNVVVNNRCGLMERLVFTCADVSLGDLYGATQAQGARFTII